jgi:hypothetical protein
VNCLLFLALPPQEAKQELAVSDWVGSHRRLPLAEGSDWCRLMVAVVRRWPPRWRPCGSWSPRAAKGGASGGARSSDVRLSVVPRG